jgi:FkbM family methyltransferase
VLRDAGTQHSIQEDSNECLSYHYIQLELLDTSFSVCVESSLTDPLAQSVSQHSGVCLNHFLPIFKCLRPESAILDIGAHIGTFSLPATALGAKVIAIEAGQKNCKLLNLAKSRNNFSNLTVVNAIAGSEPGILPFNENGPFGTVVSATEAPEPNHPEIRSINLPVLTADKILEQAAVTEVDILKIDVEGFELEVLSGLKQLFLRASPRIVLYESNGIQLHHFGKTCRDLYAFFADHGYENYRLTTDGLMKIDANALQLQAVLDHIAVKILPIPLSDEPQVDYQDNEELAWLALDLSRTYKSEERAHLARELSMASRDLLLTPQTTQAIRQLSEDSCRSVKEAAVACFQKLKEARSQTEYA